jgi:hypothetical protein
MNPSAAPLTSNYEQDTVRNGAPDVDDVKAFLDYGAVSSAAPDVVSSRPMTCDLHGTWTETTVRHKTGPGRYMPVGGKSRVHEGLIVLSHSFAMLSLCRPSSAVDRGWSAAS